MQSIFEKNMISLARVNLTLAESLMTIKANQRYEVVIGSSAEEINIFDKEKNFEPMYPNKPTHSLVEMLSSLEKKQGYPYFYFFGVGNGLAYKVMLQQFPQIKKIFVFEPSLEILLIALTLVDFSQEIEQQSILFLDANTFTFDNATYFLQDQHILLFAKVYSLNLHSDYYACFAERIMHLNAILIKAFEHSIFILGNCAVDSLVGLKQHLINFPAMIQTPTMDELVAKGKNSDILVIASTGPSLNKQIETLKKIQKHVTIVCPDASFPILSAHGITPDLVFSLERLEATAKFYRQTLTKFHKNPIFATTSIVHKKLLDAIKSDNIQMSIRPFHFLAQFNTPSWGFLGFGMSSSNMAFEFGILAHFKYCVLIGQDLSFGKDGVTHASGHIFGLNNASKNNLILLDAYGGEGKVKSTPIWKAFLTYFEQDIRRSQHSMKTFNCTEGGARIDSAIEMPFNDFVETYVDFSHEKSLITLSKPNRSEISIASKNHMKQYRFILHYLQKKKVKIETLFIQIMKFIEKTEQLYKTHSLDKINFQKVNKLLKQLETIKSFFKEPLFHAIVFDFLKSYIVSQELEIAKLQVKIVSNEEEDKAKKIEWLYLHRFWLFSLAGGIEAIEKTMQYAHARSLVYSIDTIDVLVDGVVADHITCKNMKAKKGRLFDVDMRGLCYDVPRPYRGKAICFQNALTHKELPRDFIDVIDKADEQYNELRFIESLKKPINKIKIKDLYRPKAIGFLATQKNLDDVDFVYYIKTLSEYFPSLQIYGFGFNEQMKTSFNAVFAKKTNVGYMNIKSIVEVAKNIEFYIFNAAYPKIDKNVYHYLRYYCKNINPIHFIAEYKNYKVNLKPAPSVLPYEACLKRPDLYGFTEEDVLKADNNPHKLVFETSLEEMGAVLELNENLYKFHFFHVLEHSLKDEKFKSYMHKLQKQNFEFYNIKI